MHFSSCPASSNIQHISSDTLSLSQELQPPLSLPNTRFYYISNIFFCLLLCLTHRTLLRFRFHSDVVPCCCRRCGVCCHMWGKRRKKRSQLLRSSERRMRRKLDIVKAGCCVSRISFEFYFLSFFLRFLFVEYDSIWMKYKHSKYTQLLRFYCWDVNSINIPSTLSWGPTVV